MGIIGPIDHWIAFILLAFIGGKMLWEAFTEDEDEDDGKDAEKIDLGEYLILAIATSIDALAVGISFDGYLLTCRLLHISMTCKSLHE